jgi:hypothetical protein
MLTFFRSIWARIRPRRLYRVSLEAQAHGRPSTSADATQSIVAHESVVAVVKQADQTTAYRYSDSEGHAVAADLQEDSVDLDLTGRSKSGEEGTIEVCRTLIERLRHDGQEWSDPMDMSNRGARHEEGVDCSASGPAGGLSIQVTRAERGIWASLASDGRVVVHGKLIEEAARQLRATIEKKAAQTGPHDRAGLVLALNARDTPNLAFPAVISSFRLWHGAWARSLGFRGVWMVGPSVSLTYQLDLTQDPKSGQQNSPSEPVA